MRLNARRRAAGTAASTAACTAGTAGTAGRQRHTCVERHERYRRIDGRLRHELGDDARYGSAVSVDRIGES